jgi:uncharacterized protein (DUF4415 family)
MKKGSTRPLTAAQKAELDALAAMPDDEIDTSDMPEVLDWSQARRGALYRPVKRLMTIRIDADVIEWFKSHGAPDGKAGYQTRMNQALREYIAQHEGG